MTWPIVDAALQSPDDVADSEDHARARYLLRAGPWAWPRPATDTFARAVRLAGMEQPPPPAVGTALCVTVDSPATRPGTATLWRVHACKPRESIPFVTLDRSAGSACNRSPRGVIESLPVLWQSVDADNLPQPQVEPLMSIDVSHPAGRMAGKPECLVGPSLAAAYALALASWLAECPVEPTVVASADVSEDGFLKPVYGLETKLALVERLVPSGRLLTATTAGLPPRVIGVDHLRDLQPLAFPDARTLVAGVLASREGEQRVLRRLESSILERQNHGIAWKPFIAACEELERQASDPGRARMFRLLGIIARRHLGEREPMSPIPWEDIEARHSDPRLRILAHVAQHGADTGDPPESEMPRCSAPIAGLNTTEMGLLHRRLAGALSRWRAVTGPLEPERGIQRELTLAALQHDTPEEASHPLSAWLRLTGCLGDAAGLSEAVAFRLQLQRECGDQAERGDSHLYLNQAQHFAACLLGREGLLVSGLEQVPASKAQLLSGAHRLLVLAAATFGSSEEVTAAAARLASLLEQGSRGASMDERDLSVWARTGLLSVFDLAARGHDVVIDPAAAEIIAAVRNAMVALGVSSALQDTPAPGETVGWLLDAFMSVEAEPMRRVRATEEAAGHETEAALADAIRRRYPY